MRASDYLFQLIKAMTKGDRRNFKLFAQLQEGDKKYIQLFDAICKQDEYDERLLLQQFEGERFTNQFSVAKNYLYRYILKTLHVFQKDPQDELMTLVNQVRILISKNLFDQAHKLLRKAMHQAEAMESFTDMLNLLQMEREIYFHNQAINSFSTFIGGIQETEKATVAKLENLVSYKHLQDQTKLTQKKIQEARNTQELMPFAPIIDNPLISNESAALSTRAKIQRLAILSDCAFYDGRFQDCEIFCKEIIELYEANTALKEAENLFYLLELSYLSGFLYRNQKIPEAYATLEKLRSATTLNPQEELRVFEKYSQITLALSLEEGDVENGTKAALAIEETFKSVDGKIRKSIEMTLFFHLAYFWLMVGKPSESLKWINRLLNEPKSELRVDIQCMARLLNIILHWELGNRDLVDYSLKSAYRFLYKRNRLFEFEQFVLRTMRKLNELYTDSEIRAYLSESLEQLDQILENPFEQKTISLLNMTGWIKSKIHQTTIAEIIQKDNKVKEKA